MLKTVYLLVQNLGINAGKYLAHATLNKSILNFHGQINCVEFCQDHFLTF